LVVEPAGLPPAFSGNAAISFHRTVEEVVADPAPDAVVFAVKPQIIDNVLPASRRWTRPQTLFLSIAAGKTIAGLARHLGDAAIVRVMPNTPAAIGRAISVACANPRVSAEQKQLAEALLTAIGDSVWVD